MIGRIALIGLAAMAACMLTSAGSLAQDVPGIEICTVEKTMERRTSCLQSNVEFLQKTIAKLSSDHQQKLDAVKAQIEALKNSIAASQKVVDDLQATAKKAAGDQNKTEDQKKETGAAAPKQGAQPTK